MFFEFLPVFDQGSAGVPGEAERVDLGASFPVELE